MHTIKSDSPFLVFGYAAPQASEEANKSMTELAMVVGARAGVDLAVSALQSYERVAQLLHKGNLDIAWVSPVPFIALMRTEAVVPMVSPFRGAMHYHGAVIVNAQSTIGSLKDLAGKRAAWVDRHSAAGFIVPRIEIQKAGLDVKTAFASQRFYGSHLAVARAVAEGKADFGATFVKLGPGGAVVDGPWTKMPGLEPKLRIFARFGEIPNDVIVARKTLDDYARERLHEALRSLANDRRGKHLLQACFGADELFRATTAGYESLRQATADAVEGELLDIAEEMDPELVFDPWAEHTARITVQK